MKRSIRIAALALLAVTAGCGGGGSTSPSAPQAAPPPATAAVITEQAAAVKAADGYRAASALYDAGADSAGMDPVGKSIGSPHGLSLVDLSLARLRRLVERDGPWIATKALPTDPVPCSNGGTLVLAVDDADGSGDASSGDSVAFQYDDCHESGLLLDGGLQMTGLVLTGDALSPARSVGATFVFQALRMTDETGDVLVDGSFNMQSSVQTRPSTVLDATVSGPVLQVTTNGVVDRMSDFSASIHVDQTAGTYSYTVAAVLDVAGLTLATPQAMAGTIGAFPSTGVLTVADAAGASATLVALSATSVRVDFDGDGDGQADSSQLRTWSEIAASRP